MVQSDKYSVDGRLDKAEELLEASYLAGFSMVADADGTDHEFGNECQFIPSVIVAPRIVNPWHVGRLPARKRWAKDAMAAFARRLDEVSIRPKPLTKTALVVWQPTQRRSWMIEAAQAARTMLPRLHIPFTRHTSA